jgi:glycosidase
MLLLTLRGTPTLYSGDEIGMKDVPIPPERLQGNGSYFFALAGMRRSLLRSASRPNDPEVVTTPGLLGGSESSTWA